MKKKDLKFGITAFIDLLGFGDRVLKANTVKDINDLYDAISKIQAEFEFGSKDKSVRLAQKNTDSTVLAFSDSIIVNVPLKSRATESIGAFDNLMLAISNFGLAQGLCAAESYFLRGGIDIGYWYNKANTLISGALVGAYKLEKKANVPVIALTGNAFDFFSNSEARKYYDNEYDPLLQTFRKYESAESNFWYIDYISITLESVDETDRTFQRITFDSGFEKFLFKHARNIENAHIEASSKKVKAKYVWLATYHDEIAKSATSRSDCLCKI